MAWMRWLAALACASGCASPNAAFDPQRKGDTDVLDDDGTDDVAGSSETSQGGDEAPDGTAEGGTPAVCDPPEQSGISFWMFENGDEYRPCGVVKSAIGCQLGRDPDTEQWTLGACCFEQACEVMHRYEIEIVPTPPDEGIVAREARAVKVAFEYGPEDAGCELRWFEIVDMTEPVNPVVPPVIYLGSRVLDPGGEVPISADVTGALDTPCACASDDTECCPGDVGYHELTMSAPPINVVLSESDPAFVVPLVEGQVWLEAYVLRAWQPPYCDAAPEHHWFVRRLVN